MPTGSLKDRRTFTRKTPTKKNYIAKKILTWFEYSAQIIKINFIWFFWSKSFDFNQFEKARFVHFEAFVCFSDKRQKSGVQHRKAYDFLFRYMAYIIKRIFAE